MSSPTERLSALAYHFAVYRLEPARCSLTRTDGTALTAAGKPFDVGSDLDVDAIMECGVRRTGDELVLAVQMIDMAWAAVVLEPLRMAAVLPANLRQRLRVLLDELGRACSQHGESS